MDKRIKFTKEEKIAKYKVEIKKFVREYEQFFK